MSITKQELKKTWRNLKKQGLTDVVIEILARDGAKGVTMDNVALAAGVAKGTLYAYFKDKQDLLKAAIDSSVAPMVEELNAILNEQASPDKIVRKFIERHLTYFEDHRSFFQILVYDRMMAQARLRRYKSCRYQDMLHSFAEVFERGMDQGLFRRADALKIAAMLIEANIAVINQRLLSPEPGPVQQDVSLLADVFLHGICEPQTTLKVSS